VKIIGIEEHFVTADIRAAWAASPIGQEGTGGFDRGEIEERLDDLGEQPLALMDESGVDVQVLSVPALHNLEPKESVTLARRTNDLAVATIAKYPTRFQGFATLPTFYLSTNLLGPEKCAALLPELLPCARRTTFRPCRKSSLFDAELYTRPGSGRRIPKPRQPVSRPRWRLANNSEFLKFSVNPRCPPRVHGRISGHNVTPLCAAGRHTVAMELGECTLGTQARHASHSCRAPEDSSPAVCLTVDRVPLDQVASLFLTV
jgi:hypothetical protein